MFLNLLQIDEKESKSPEKNINKGENAKFGVDLPPNPSTPVSYKNFYVFVKYVVYVVVTTSCNTHVSKDTHLVTQKA